ncbi:Guanine nucleotide-binding protein-like 1 [Operophtera brumata]|uniref:Guanine nucleotide-binding protein-like 1 n=1 Tax=Operophtera brumata TaxID=104452 RepID=A0A0L7L265_OPEBR|nr:Guanine nucleotide-binding protein-like 1 [Operophtera brumata]
MNAVLSKKRLSVSKTPGHTKHFQTIYATPQPNVGKSSLMNAVLGKKRLSVSKTPGHTKHFQTIYATPQRDENWSPRDICDAWAKKRGYLTAKAARLDTYRAANSLLRMALDGKICLWLRPPGFTEQKGTYNMLVAATARLHRTERYL